MIRSGLRIAVPPRPWYVLTLATTVLLAAALGAQHLIYRSHLEAATATVRQHGRADQDLTRGFLQYELGGSPGSPWQREQGLALLTQSIQEFGASAARLPKGAELSRQFEQDLQALRSELVREPAAGAERAHELALRLALVRLQKSADQIDGQLRSGLLREGEALDRIYRWSLALALLLIVATSLATLRTVRLRRLMYLRLADQEALFRSLVEQSLAGICIVRAGQVTYANARTAEIMGTTVEALVGRPVQDYIIAGQQARGTEAMGQLLRGEIPRYVGSFTSPRPDGREVEFEVQANLIAIGGEPAVVAVLQDVSERQRLAREQLATLRLLTAITGNCGDAVFAKDRDARYILFNPQSASLSGGRADDALGKTTPEVFPGEQGAAMLASDADVMRTGKPHRFELDFTTARGRRTFECVKGPLLADDGEIMGVFGISRDVTSRREQELALTESRAQLAAVIDALDEGLMVIDAQGRLLRINPAACRINGLRWEDGQPVDMEGLADQFVLETLDGHILELVDWPSRRVLRGEVIHNLELLVRRRDKVWSRIISYSGTPVTAADGSLRFILLTCTDVTLRKHAEAAMHHTQRMESLGTLAAGIAHDFNNLLLAISGNAALASAEVGEGHPAHESIREVQRAGQRATDLVRRILLFARAEESRRQNGDLRAVVEEALKLLKPTLPARIQLGTDFAPQREMVNMDASQIHQVVVNLVTNAAHAIDTGDKAENGQIQVGLVAVELPAGAELGGQLLKAGRYARLLISDNGCGMEPTVLTRIFDPFFTTKPVGKGTGLGLPMVHGIVHEHGGAIEVTSRAGQGTQVAVYLPLVRSAPQAELADASPTAGRGQRVLYVDDEEALVFLVTRYLKRLGYRVTGFSDPAEAVASYLAHPGLYDVIVTDLSMPGQSGIEVARRIRASDTQVPIILMSGYLRPEDRVAATAVGVTEVLLKPSTVDELGKAIDRQLH